MKALFFALAIFTIATLVAVHPAVAFPAGQDLGTFIENAQSTQPGPWSKYTGNPVVSSTEPWEGGYIWGAHVMKDGTLYKMWYAGIQPSHIGYATSEDGLAWDKHTGNPVLDPGATGEWDEEGVSEPFVLKENGVYKMWYWGRNAGGIMQIGYATSPDGITWTKHAGNPVVMVGGAGSWEEVEVGSPWVIFQGGTYRIWYLGQDSTGLYAIGYATSPDGITWTKDSGNPILTGSAGTWDEQGVLAPSVIFDGETYRMWYFGKDGTKNRIGYATSSDGLSWLKHGNNPVLEPGSDDAWDGAGVAFPKMMLEDGLYKMWYLGEDSDSTTQLGYATAPELYFIYLPLIIR